MVEEKVKKNDLVGKVVKLDPKKSGMLVDTVNNFTFSFFEEGKDSREVTKDMDTSVIERNIEYGILRVYDKDKDVTKDFGGPSDRVVSRIPLVKEGIPESTSDDKEDRGLLNVLNRNDSRDIEKAIRSIDDYDLLRRLLDFEQSGENPASQPRRDVVEMITDRMKNVSGISMDKEPTEEEEVIIK